MRRNRLLTATAVAAAVLSIAGCGGSGADTSSDARTTDSAEPATEPGATTTTKATIAPATTIPPDPSVFNPNAIGDPMELASFVFTTDEFHSFNGQPSQVTTTYGYISEPYSVSVVADYHDGSNYRQYFVDGRVYEVNNSGYWYLYEKGSLAAPPPLDGFGVADALYRVASAVFVGAEDYLGIAAYHYTFDETNIDLYSSYTPEKPSPEIEGEFYLAQDGNYVLYAHSRQVAAGDGYELIDEFTNSLSSVNAPMEIALPDDMLPLKEALDAGATYGIPMQPDATVDSMINYNSGGIGVYYYEYTTTWKNEAEFIAFYTALPPTNGWEVTHIGQVKNFDEFCFDGNCVLIKNGDKQFILYFDGRNLHADYDREHRFVAQ